MARQFGSYSTRWPLGTTIEETFLFQDEDGNPVDLTDCDVRMQIRDGEVLRDPNTGAGETDPVMELVTDTALYPTPPAWPLIQAFRVGLDPNTPDPTDGYIVLRLDDEDSWALSPTNEAVVLLYDIEIIDTIDTAVIPLLRGKIKTGSRRTLGLP